MPEGEAIEHAHGDALDRERAAQGRGAQLRHPQAAARVRRRRQRPAQGHLRAAQRTARVAGRLAAASPTCARAWSRDMFRVHVPEDSVEEQWDVAGLENALEAELQPRAAAAQVAGGASPSSTTRRCSSASSSAPRPPTGRRSPAGAEASFRQYERYVMLQILDAHWREHLAALDHLRQGIHLRGYAQKNPKQEYKREAFELFGAMLEAVKLEVTKTLTAVRDPRQGRRAAGRRQGARARTCSCSMPATTRRSPASGDAPEQKPRRAADRAPDAEGRPQRSLPLRLGQEVQALPRQTDLSRDGGQSRRARPAVAARRARRRAGRRDGRRHARPNRKDLLVMRLAPGAAVAGVFTQNRFCAAPVVAVRRSISQNDRCGRWW